MSSGSGAGPLVPTFHGFVSNSMDGLILFEACLSGKLHHVPRRPHDRERAQLIKSGSIFIYEENASGIKRWTDGVAWSPSRILGNFLIYRELEKPFPPGEKKRAMKRKRQSVPGEPYPRRDSDENDTTEQVTPITPPTPTASSDVKSEVPGNDQDKELERSLIGSLVDSYGFRPEGLVKKTMSISVNGTSHHMVSYYKVDDVKNNVLPRPMSDPRLQGIAVRPELYLKQNFRSPVEETEHYAIDGNMHAHPQMMYSMQGTPYGVRPGQYFGGQQQQQPYQSMYTMPASSAGSYGAVAGTAWPAQQPQAGYSTYGGQNYGNYYKGADPNGKVEGMGASSQSMPYGSQYTPAYPAMQRSSSHSTPNMAQSAYQTPVQPSSSTFSGMTSRPSYSNPSMTSPTTNGQSQPSYTGGSAQQYAVRSPTQQSYAVQSAPVSQSPIPAKSEHSGPASAPVNDMAYRNAPYPVGGTSQGSDMSGLGISSHSSYSAPGQQGQPYSGYGASAGQPYHGATDLGAAQAGAHYSQ